VSEAIALVLSELRREFEVFSEDSLGGDVGVSGRAGTTWSPDGDICVVYVVYTEEAVRK
jgi:hypothetical protein